MVRGLAILFWCLLSVACEGLILSTLGPAAGIAGAALLLWLGTLCGERAVHDHPLT